MPNTVKELYQYILDEAERQEVSSGVMTYAVGWIFFDLFERADHEASQRGRRSWGWRWLAGRLWTGRATGSGAPARNHSAALCGRAATRLGGARGNLSRSDSYCLPGHDSCAYRMADCYEKAIM